MDFVGILQIKKKVAFINKNGMNTWVYINLLTISGFLDQCNGT